MLLPSLSLFLALLAPTAELGRHDIDFLVGSWVIEDPQGKPIGTAEIVAQVPGTMLYEKRTVGDGGTQSLWLENAERNGGWTQLFVGPVGRTREFKPESASGEWPLVMGAHVTLQDGTPVQFRMTLTRESDNASGRHLEISRDAGQTWKTVFDYRYRRNLTPDRHRDDSRF